MNYFGPLDFTVGSDALTEKPLTGINSEDQVGGSGSPWTEDTYNSLSDPYKTEIIGDKIDQNCSAFRRVSVNLSKISDVSEDTALFAS